MWIQDLAMHPLREPAQFANATTFIRQTSFTTSNFHQMVDAVREVAQHPFALFEAGASTSRRVRRTSTSPPRGSGSRDGGAPARRRHRERRGAYSRFISPAIGLIWIMVVSRVLLTRNSATERAPDLVTVPEW